MRQDLVSSIIAMLSQSSNLHGYSTQRLYMALSNDISQVSSRRNSPHSSVPKAREHTSPPLSLPHSPFPLPLLAFLCFPFPSYLPPSLPFPPCLFLYPFPPFSHSPPSAIACPGGCLDCGGVWGSPGDRPGGGGGGGGGATARDGGRGAGCDGEGPAESSVHLHLPTVHT